MACAAAMSCGSNCKNGLCGSFCNLGGIRCQRYCGLPVPSLSGVTIVRQPLTEAWPPLACAAVLASINGAAGGEAAPGGTTGVALKSNDRPVSLRPATPVIVLSAPTTPTKSKAAAALLAAVTNCQRHRTAGPTTVPVTVPAA